MFQSGGFLKITLKVFLLLLLHSISWRLWQRLLGHWQTQHQLPVTYYLRMCTVLFCSCLSQFQICAASSFCVSRTQLTVQSSRCKFCLLKENVNRCVHIVNQHENPTLRHNRYFNIAIAQRQHKQYMLPSESMRSAAVSQAFVPRGSNRTLDPYSEYLPSCRKMQ